MVHFRQSRRMSKTPTTKSNTSSQLRKRSQTSASTASIEPPRRRITLGSRLASSDQHNGSRASVATESRSELNPVQEDDDNLDHVIMAVDKIRKSTKSTLGCSYYVAREGVLRCMEDVDDLDDGLFNSCVSFQY